MTEMGSAKPHSSRAPNWLARRRHKAAQLTALITANGRKATHQRCRRRTSTHVPDANSPYHMAMEAAEPGQDPARNRPAIVVGRSARFVDPSWLPALVMVKFSIRLLCSYLAQRKGLCLRKATCSPACVFLPCQKASGQSADRSEKDRYNPPRSTSRCRFHGRAPTRAACVGIMSDRYCRPSAG